MLEWAQGLKIAGTPLYLDSRAPRSHCFVSHAHSDHLGVHHRCLSTAETAALMERRLGCTPSNVVDCGEPDQSFFDNQTSLTLFQAGHILGSAMLRVQRPEGTLLYTGDFKLRPSLTAARADPPQADVLVMESTYGLPMFRFPPAQLMAERLVELATDALRNGQQPIAMGYSLGKAQEIVRILSDAGLPVTCHGAVAGMNEIYERFGVALGPHRRYRAHDFHGPAALDLAERGVLVAPPRVARTAFVNRFENPCRIILSGWGMLKNATYRYGVDHALPLSDHADFDELLELVERVRPKKIFTHHGYRQFAETLRSMGHDATVAEPSTQLMLFGE